jgi:hypothetical protein
MAASRTSVPSPLLRDARPRTGRSRECLVLALESLARDSPDRVRYAITIFASACLLFQIQPMIGKMILPWFGGSAAVWTASLLFFQLALLAGYAYAHASLRWLRPRAQVAVQCSLLIASCLVLPIGLAASCAAPEVDRTTSSLRAGASAGGALQSPANALRTDPNAFASRASPPSPTAACRPRRTCVPSFDPWWPSSRRCDLPVLAHLLHQLPHLGVAHWSHGPASPLS